ncbi:MAG: 4-(cytidine 5'-diphospho)-2-C-methyl-D-erythritol kinase [Sediminibacterium sp.]|nr:4-(cytidine 5'-diphospho)-2-C-methyl-D-erythritol kinase [Sediminibacterium sp.]
MVVFPNCKINLGLHITGKRTDGYHELETVFYPIQLCDSLELISANTTIDQNQKDINPIEFSASGLTIPGDATNNLCVKAYQILKADFPQLPSVKIHLHKVIPMGAGLGGGSADGAFALQLLNEKYQLNISEDQLIDYAAQLGSDCAFFILNKPSYALGRGEKLMPLAVDLSAYQFVLVHPGIHINTKWAFEQITPSIPSVSLKEVLHQPIESWKNNLYNDFEAPILAAYPEMNLIKNALYEDGAIYASMSGSGSSFFGIYPKQHKIEIKKQFQFRIDIVE